MLPSPARTPLSIWPPTLVVETPWPEVWKNNLRGTMNALEAARRNGVARFVYASSNHVTGMYEHEFPYSAIIAGEYSQLDPNSIPLIDSDTPLRPDSPYAIGKILGEAAARYYADVFGLRTICLRIGTVNPEDQTEASPRFCDAVDTCRSRSTLRLRASRTRGLEVRHLLRCLRQYVAFLGYRGGTKHDRLPSSGRRRAAAAIATQH